MCRQKHKESCQEAQDIKRVREAKSMRRQINHNIRWKIARPDMMRQEKPLMSQRKAVGLFVRRHLTIWVHESHKETIRTVCDWLLVFIETSSVLIHSKNSSKIPLYWCHFKATSTYQHLTCLVPALLYILWRRHLSTSCLVDFVKTTFNLLCSSAKRVGISLKIQIFQEKMSKEVDPSCIYFKTPTNKHQLY